RAREDDLQIARAATNPDLRDLAPRPAVNRRRIETGSKPVLECKTPNLPEPLRDLVLLRLGEIAPVPADVDRALDGLVDELPGDALEARHVVTMDDVDSLGPVLAEQRCPLVRALATSDDQDTFSGELLEAHELACVD